MNIRMQSKVLLIVLSVLVNMSYQHSKEEWKQRAIYQVLVDRFARPNYGKGNCNNLQNYCGGTWQGLRENLDYIVNLGFDAIWITPVVENTEGGYHGYWAKNLYEMNGKFGGKEELKKLVDECHKRDIWVMVDVVGNHMGPVGTDYSQLSPFNKQEHYHDYCIINGQDFTSNQQRVENCRLAGLPDLKQENQYVQDELVNWIQWLVKEFEFDGIRIDTCPEVPKWFWSRFTQAAGVYQVCEVFDGRQDYLRDYQNHVDGLLNYPQYFTLRDCFSQGHSLNNIQNMKYGMKSFKDEGALGVFSDNHDNPRFLHFNGDWEMLKNYIAFNLGSEGVPIFYYGTEQGYTGANDPNNREVLWNNLNQDHQLFKFVQTINQVRKQSKYQEQSQIQRYSTDNFYAFSRGEVMFLFTNVKYYVSYAITYHPYNNGDVLCSIFDSNRCYTVNNNQFQVNLNNGTPDVLVKKGSFNRQYI